MKRNVALGLALLSFGCRGPQPCVEVASSDRIGTPVRSYDEFTRVTTIQSSFLLTPDMEWTLRDQREDGLIHWSVDMWLSGSSASPELAVTLRVSCLRPVEDGERGACQNCDEVCNERNGTLEILADGVPLSLPRARYRRVPVASPTPESPSTWASTIALSARPEVWWPLEQARHVKLRVCGSIVATLNPSELASLHETLRHHRAIAPQ